MCVPYTLEACKEAAKKLSMYTFGGAGDWGTKGCYSYGVLDENPDNRAKIFFGLGGTEDDRKRTLPKGRIFRTPGHDCYFGDWRGH